MERLLLVDHRHEQNDDDWPLGRRGHHHVGEELLVLLVAADHFAYRVNRLQQQNQTQMRGHVSDRVVELANN